jgi:hypothetical protein
MKTWLGLVRHGKEGCTGLVPGCGQQKMRNYDRINEELRMQTGHRRPAFDAAS